MLNFTNGNSAFFCSNCLCLYSLAVKLPALLAVIQKWVKETTGKAWDWDYIVYVKNREELKLTNSNGYVVPYNKIKSL